MSHGQVSLETLEPNPQFPGVEDVTIDEVLAKKENLCIVDVRRTDEWTGEFGHIPGARHIILDTLPDHLVDLPQDGTIVFVCRSGGRSAQATALARSNGFQSVFNMKGGMMAWDAAGYPSEDKSSL